MGEEMKGCPLEDQTAEIHASCIICTAIIISTDILDTRKIDHVKVQFYDYFTFNLSYLISVFSINRGGKGRRKTAFCLSGSRRPEGVRVSDIQIMPA